MVTGSTGIAAASARRLAAEGAAVVVVSRTPGHAETLAAAVAQAGGTALGIAADLTVEPEADVAVAAAIERFGRLDGLFAVAGGAAAAMATGRSTS